MIIYVSNVLIMQTWLLLSKSSQHYEETKMSIFALLCLFSADYLTSHSRKFDVVLKMKEVSFSQILDYLLYLLVGIVLIQLPK